MNTSVVWILFLEDIYSQVILFELQMILEYARFVVKVDFNKLVAIVTRDWNLFRESIYLDHGAVNCHFYNVKAVIISTTIIIEANFSRQPFEFNLLDANIYKWIEKLIFNYLF